VHQVFVDAIEAMKDSATPKKILLFMKDSGIKSNKLTRLRVASHLQKYARKTGT
jgi:SHAQKYF class myb-like DNA-binding protein